MENTNAEPPVTTPVSEDKTVAILSYVTIIGFIIAIIMHGNKKTKLGAYHLRQALGLFVTAVAFGIGGFILAFIPIIGWIAFPLIWIGFFVLALMGLIAAANGQIKPLPILGENYQKWFGTAFE